MDVEEVKEEFERRKRDFSSLEEEARFILQAAIKKNKIKTHSMPSRVKDLSSFLEKAKRKESVRPFDEIRDIVGLRVVCLFLSDIPLIAQVIRESFTVLSEDDKIEGPELSSFGYMSLHFIAEMRKEYKGPRYDSLTGIPLEIQVRTILMDAWANVSHYLAYKTDIDVPTHLRRDFNALSGLFYVADSHFELFFKSSKASGEKMIQLASSSRPAISEQEINLDSMTAYLRARLPDRKQSNTEDVSQLVKELSEAGYRTIGQVDDILNRAAPALPAFESDSYPGASGRFRDVGVVRVSIGMVDPTFKAYSSGSPREKYEKLVLPPT
jgi:putative GTP pyrophosphokinase